MAVKVSHEVFESLKGFTSNKKESIYKSELFSGMSEKERKSFRRQLRAKRDAMINAFYNASAIGKTKKEVATAWKKYAEKVYTDASYIFEENTTSDKATIIAKFVADVNKELTPVKK